MLQKNYVELLQAFCMLTGIKNADAVLKTGNLNIKEVAFTLLPPNDSHPDIFRVLCDYGPVSTQNEAKFYKRLLEINLLTCVSGCFVLNPENDRVLLHYSLKLSDGNAASLLKCLELCADGALQWRKTGYMGKSDYAGISGSIGSMQTTLLKQHEMQAESAHVLSAQAGE